MMHTLRKVAVAILFAILVVAFAVGIGGRNYFDRQAHDALASVGSVEITSGKFERTYQRMLDNLSNRSKRQISPREAQAAGLPGRVLQTLIQDAAIDQEAHKLGLGLSEDGLRESLMRNDMFDDGAGKFSKQKYQEFLQRFGYSATGFEAELKEDLIRRQLRGIFDTSAIVPKALLDAYNRYLNERRTLSYFIVKSEAAGAIQSPSAEALQAYFEDHKTSFRAPEYRKVAVAAITPEAFKDKFKPSDDELKAIYDQKAKSYGSPERRKLEIIPFQTKQAAEAASAALANGKDFLDAGKEAGFKQPELDAGVLSKQELREKFFANDKIADAAFSLEKGKIGAPLEGPLSTVIIRVLEVIPAHEKTFDEVKDQIRDEVVKRRTSEEIAKINKAFEDDRTTGVTIAESAKKQNVPLVELTFDRGGKTSEGKQAEVTGVPIAALAEGAFKYDVGVETVPLRLQSGGYAWFDVADIVKPRQKAFDEVKDEVSGVWLREQIRAKLAEKSRELEARIEKGEAIADAAKSVNAEVKTSAPVKRGDAEPGLPVSAIAQAFALGEGGAASAMVADGSSRAIFQVAKIEAPGELQPQEAEGIREKLAQATSADNFAQFISGVKARAGTKIDNNAISALAGNVSGQETDE